MKRILCFTLSLALLFLCGCSGKSNAYTPTGDAIVPEDYSGPAITTPQDGSQQSLVMTYYPNITMNPYLCTEITNRSLFPLLYQGLFAMDREYRTYPMLCKQYSVSEDMTQYTIHLENATFSDGSALTGEDVVASLRAAWESTVYKGRFMHISDISAAGNVVVITLDTPMENLPLLLDIPIVKASQVAEDHPLGTGPYTLSNNGSAPCLQRRTNWWCSSVDMQIVASTIALTKAESVTQIRDNFEFSDLNLVCADPCSDNYADYRCDYELWDCESGMLLYLTFCKDSTVFADPNVRAALTYAIDRDALVAQHYRGFARSAALPASPLFPHYSQSLANRYRYDPERFKQAITDAGLTGSTVKLLVNKDDSLRLRAARSIAEMLEAGGLVVELSELSGYSYRDALTYRVFDLYLGQTRLSPNMDLSAFFHTNGNLSYGGVNDTTAYNLCLQALENHGNYYTLHQTVMDNGLLCPILTGSYAVYATRGLLPGLNTARDNAFYYSLGKTMEQALILEPPTTEPTTPAT